MRGMRTRIAVFGLLLTTTSLLFAQEATIEICDGRMGNIRFTTDDPEGIHEYQWYLDEGTGFREYSTRRSLQLSGDDLDGSFIYGIETTDECELIVSDTFKIQKIGINTNRSEDVFNFNFNPLINGTSSISLKEEYKYLVDPSDPAKPDSVWINTGGEIIHLDGDTTEFVIPIQSFDWVRVNGLGDTTRRINYSILARWDQCGTTSFVSVPQQWSKSNLITFTDDNSGRFFISGLLDTLEAGQNLGNFVGAIDNNDQNVTIVSKMRPKNNAFLETSEALLAVDSLGLKENIPHYFGTRNDSRAPTNLPSGDYKITVEGYDNATGELIYYDSTFRYYENNDPSIYGTIDLQPQEGFYMGDERHVMDMTYYAGPVMRFVNAGLEYFFLSENKLDTFRTGYLESLPYTDVDDTTAFSIEIITGSNEFQYDTIYFEFIDSLSNKQFAVPAATNLNEEIIRTSNGYISQISKQGNELEGYIVGDSTYSDGDFYYNEFVDIKFTRTELFANQTENLPKDSLIGEFYTLQNQDTIKLLFDLGFLYKSFYGNINPDSIGLKWQLDLHTDYVQVTNFNTSRTPKSEIIESFTGAIPFEYGESNDEVIIEVNIPQELVTEFDPFPFTNNFDIEEDQYFIDFYLLGDSTNNILDTESELSLSDTLKFEIAQNKIMFAGDIDLGFVQEYDSYYLNNAQSGIRGNVERWPVYLWNAQHNSHRLLSYLATTPEAYEPAFYTQFNYEADLNFEFADSLANVEIGIYSTTQEFNDLVLNMIAEQERTFIFGQELDNRALGFMDRVLKFVENEYGGSFLKGFHLNQNYFQLEKVDILDNLNDYRSNPEFNVDMVYDSLDYDPDKRGYIFVIDPYNKILETNEENNIYFFDIHEYCDSGVDLAITAPYREYYDQGKGQYVRSFDAGVRDFKLMEDDERWLFNTLSGLEKVNDGEKMDVQFVVRNNGTLPSTGAEFQLRAYPVAPALPDSITLIRSDEDFDRYWERSNIVGTFPVSDFDHYVGRLFDFRNGLEGRYGPIGELLELEIDPSTFVPPGNSFFLLADLISEDDCIDGANDRTRGRIGWAPSGYRNKRVYSMQKFLVGSPCIVLENIEYPDLGDVACGTPFPISFDVTNIEPEFSTFNEFYIIIEDNVGNVDTLTFDGIGAGETIPVTLDKKVILPFNQFPKRDEKTGEKFGKVRRKDIFYQVDMTLDLTNINVPDTIKNYIIQDEMSVSIREGSIEPPKLKMTDGRIMRWDPTGGENPSYHYDIYFKARSGPIYYTGGVTQDTLVNMIAAGFPQPQYGTYSILIFATDEECGWSELVGANYEFAPPPPPSKSSGTSVSGGGSGGGGSSGGGCGGSSCKRRVTNCGVIVKTRYDEELGKFWMKFYNPYNVRVESKHCIEGDCGGTTLDPGEEHTWWSYDVSSDPKVSITFDVCRYN